MKRIVKTNEPKEFAAWKEADHMRHRPRWRRVPTAVKKKVHRSLLREQGFICCYCESSVVEDDSHVEHFRPKRKCRNSKLDYGNLHCSCQRELSPGEPRHCGHAKGSWFDEKLLVSPLSSDCESRFRFTANGEILPHDEDDGARATIQRLRLNLPKLQALRAGAVDALRDSPANEISRLLARNVGGRLLPFCSTIRHVLLG